METKILKTVEVEFYRVWVDLENGHQIYLGEFCRSDFLDNMPKVSQLPFVKKIHREKFWKAF